MGKNQLVYGVILWVLRVLGQKIVLLVVSVTNENERNSIKKKKSLLYT